MELFSTLQTQTIIPSTNSATQDKTAEDIARENAEQQQIDFLNLLLTQLANQNPLDPMDTDEFSAQLTRYSILEQGIETNERLSVTNDLLGQTATTSSFSYIGKDVEIETNMNAVSDNQASWTYLIDGNADDVKLTVTDDNGRRLGEFDGSVEPGAQTFTLDTSSYNVEEGQILYLSVNATQGVDNDNLNSRTTSIIEVDGVWSDGEQNYLTAGELSFRSSDILKVVEQNIPVQQPQI